MEVADFFNVSRETIRRWQLEDDEFCGAMAMPSLQLNENVERSLYERAVGYTFESEKVFNYRGKIVRAKIREHVPPDVNAARLWLTNCNPEKWRDKAPEQGGMDSIVSILQEIADKRHAERLAQQAAKTIDAQPVEKKGEGD